MEYLQKDDRLKLDNQLCFRLYVVSRLMTRAYQPFLEKLGITYPQYLVLLVLWEQDGQLVKQISEQLFLKTNTVTPLLKRLETQELIIRERSTEDERSVMIRLTKQGIKLKQQAREIPNQIPLKLINSSLKTDDLVQLKDSLDTMIKTLSD